VTTAPPMTRFLVGLPEAGTASRSASTGSTFVAR
jgi:hypothetical protein